MGRISRRSFLAASGTSVALGGLARRAIAAAEAPKRGGSLTATWGGLEPQALFVPAGGGSSPFFTSTKILERLARMEPDLTFSPVLAERWAASADFREYTIAIRPGVAWHDGKPLTVEDVVFSMTQYWKPISAGPALRSFAGAEAKDDRTVVMRFDRPMPELTFLSVLAGPGGLILPKHIYAGSDIVTNPANNAPIGTGPWKYKEWVRGSHVEYLRNPSYWRPGLPYLDRLIIRWWRDPAARSAAFEANELDIGVFNPVPPPDVKRLTQTGRFVAERKGYENATWFTTLEFNTRNPILGKRDVRQAMLYAIDRQFIADTIFFGLAKPGVSPIASSNRIYFTDDVPKYPLDPAKAAKLLDAAGFPAKAGGKRFTVNLLAAGWFAENGKIGAYLKQAFEDVGVGVNLSVPDRPTSIKRIYTDYDFDLAISNFVSAIEPVPTITQYFTTDGIVKGAAFRNASGFSSKEMDDIVARVAVETDPEKRKTLVHDFARLASAEVPILPLVEIASVTMARTDVRNYSNAADYMGESWADIWLDR